MSSQALYPDRSVRKSGKGGRNVVLVVGGLLLASCLGCGLCGGGFYLYFVHEIEEPIADADRAVVITADKLAEHVHDFTPRAGLGKLKKVRHYDGSREVEYEYETSEGDAEPFYILCNVTVEKDVETAQGSYMGQNAGLKIGLSLQAQAPQQVEKNNLYRWGDESRCVLLMNGGKPVGTLFAGRKGKRVFHLVVVGAFFDDAESLRDLLDPVLKNVDGYNP